jgi:hypothetical protein
MNINLSIDRLILEGVSIPQAQRPLLQASVEAELGRLLMENGLSAELMAGGAMPSISAGGMQLTPGLSPVQMGQQIARSVYGGIGS